MIFISAAIGAILLLSALGMSKQSFFGKDCYYYGELTVNTFCYNPGIHHTLVAVGLALLALAGFLFVKTQMTAEQNRPRHSPVSSTMPSHQPVVTSILTKPAWLTLREFDADIQAAVAQLKPFDAKAEERLATAYLAVNDKSLLSSIVATIVADEEQAAIARQEEKSRRAVTMSKLEEELLVDRETRAEHTIGLIKGANMVFAGRKVVSAEMYYGDIVANQGWAKIVYENGREELRAGSAWILLKES